MTNPVTVILSTAYLPPIEWFVYFLFGEKILIEQHETYPKQTYRNRCEIATANGKLSLTIPVIKVHGNHTKTKDIIISNNQNWQTQHWRALTAAYANSPFFLYYQDDIRVFYFEEFDNLMDFNLAFLKQVMELMQIEKAFELTREFDINQKATIDLRTEITPKKPFNKLSLPDYYQTFQEKSGFFPSLSIIDLLFNTGPEAADLLKATVERNKLILLKNLNHGKV
jgi:hypothetical protein